MWSWEVFSLRLELLRTLFFRKERRKEGIEGGKKEIMKKKNFF